jgi:O-antigen/teichoic acid export membrane protein
VIGALLGFGLGAVLLARSFGFPTWAPRASRWRELAWKSLPFGIQGIFMVMLFRLDAVILGQLSTERAVGDYGAAYRMFEATLFIPYAINSAFVAMYAYLTPTSTPTINFVFGRSIKFALVCLLPVGVVFAVFPEQLVTAIFGDELAEAAGALRLLGAAVPLIGLVTLCSTFVVFRGPSRAIVILTAVITALNVALNFALIPDHAQNGAAAAMLVSEGLFAGGCLVIAYRRVGGFDWRNSFVAPLVAAAAMLAAMLLIPASAWIAMPAGLIVYAVVLFGVERVASPEDFAFAKALLTGAIGAAPAGALEERE